MNFNGEEVDAFGDVMGLLDAGIFQNKKWQDHMLRYQNENPGITDTHMAILMFSAIVGFSDGGAKFLLEAVYREHKVEVILHLTKTIRDYRKKEYGFTR